MAGCEGGVAVVMVPLPAQGHLNQFLHLARLVSSSYCHVSVHYAASKTHVDQILRRYEGVSIDGIKFEPIPTPPFPSPPPVPTDSPLKFPHHLLPTFESSSVFLRDPLTSLVRHLAGFSRRVVVLHDTLMGSAVRECDSIPNVERYVFRSASAFAVHLITTGSISLDECCSDEFLRFMREESSHLEGCRGSIFNTCLALEAASMDSLAALESNRGKKLWAVGPFNPWVPASERRHSCVEWLDRHPRNSVIYVSFGTTSSITREQLVQLAAGLERSGVIFLWVLRAADRGDLSLLPDGVGLPLPDGYEERVKRRGIIVRDWAPQLQILGHPAVGGFMSHCGWNSCMESLSMGVPIASWPMHSDQPANSLLVVQLGVGLLVRGWARRGHVVTSVEVERAVRRLMHSDEGVTMRDKAEKLACAIRASASEGGESRIQLDSFIAHLTRRI